MIKVADFMTRELVTVQEHDDLALAESILRLGGVRHLPVVHRGKLVGLVTQRDLLRSGASGGGPTARAILARDIMTREVTTVGPEVPLADAASLMLRHKYGCLPVCAPDATLLGIITESDFVRFAADVVRDMDLVQEAVATRGDA
ncbi:MAG TPA: CBS domain-containing protein [Anaeromyxobacteraceae bacterium]|nr:CBS domain-containing protein [Anaeromyxobacteraceae bacterium]